MSQKAVHWPVHVSPESTSPMLTWEEWGEKREQKGKTCPLQTVSMKCVFHPEHQCPLLVLGGFQQPLRKDNSSSVKSLSLIRPVNRSQIPTPPWASTYSCWKLLLKLNRPNRPYRRYRPYRPDGLYRPNRPDRPYRLDSAPCSVSPIQQSLTDAGWGWSLGFSKKK